jgi:hypothetical protein
MAAELAVQAQSLSETTAFFKVAAQPQSFVAENQPRRRSTKYKVTSA